MYGDQYPYCFGRNPLYRYAELPCHDCMYAAEGCLEEWVDESAKAPPAALDGLLRVYARENHSLRARVDALEWVRECEALPVGIVDWHPYFMTEAERPTAKAFDDAQAEIDASIAAARAAV